MSSGDGADASSERDEGEAADRVVFARGAWSVLMTGEPHADSDRYVGRALPALLRERWAIRATVPASGGTYFILARKDLPDLDSNQPPESAPPPPWRRGPFWSITRGIA
jgi:hypothetical protein